MTSSHDAQAIIPVEATVVPTAQTSALPVPLRERFSSEKVDLIRRTVADGCDDDELELFLYQAQRMGLDPLVRQIHAVKRGDKLNIQVAIDGYRLIADRTGKYAGNDDPVFDGGEIYTNDGRAFPYSATVTVWKLVEGVRCPFTATARWEEYAPENERQAFLWYKMPRLMLAKCFDEQTEVLTDQGFQRFRDVTGRILQVTDQGIEPTDAKPFFQAWDGEMVTLDSDDLNFCVTPNHDMVTTDGKVEAATLYEQARSRPRHFIPRTVAGSRREWPVSDREIELAAAYLADGQDITGGFRIAVSRPHKVEALRRIGGEVSLQYRQAAGSQARTAVRTITTRADKTLFTYRWADVAWLCVTGKGIATHVIPQLSRRQARLFVDTLIAFDGHTDKRTGVRRFYTSRTDHMAAFELACVVAGYAVSQRASRTSDISARPNYYVTVSSRSEIPVIRWGRDYRPHNTGNRAGRTGLGLTTNASGFVWCVTVPAGVIVVRRNGFSMLCGNCAEALALRKAFPAELSGVYIDEEMHQADDERRGSISYSRQAPQARQPAGRAAAQTLSLPARGGKPSSGTGAGLPATEAQIKFIYKVAKDQGWNDAEVEARCRELYGEVPSGLTRGDASKFIDALKDGRAAG